MPNKPMRCIYLTSVYPCTSETFILREMQHLSLLGWDVAIFRIRGKEKFGSTKSFSGSYLSPVMLNPVYWIRGLNWAFKYRRAELTKMLSELWNAKTNALTKIKLLSLSLTILGIAKYIESEQLSFDHIRAHFLHSEALSAYWLAKLIRIPYSITIHTRMTYYPLFLIENMVKQASFCVGISKEAIELAKRLRGTSDGLQLIRNGIEYHALQNKESIISSDPVIVAVGRLIPKKGFDVLIKACALLKRAKINFICRIIGSGSEFVYLKKLIVDNELSEQVYLVGALSFDDVVNEYQKATLLVAPSRVCNDDVDGLPTVMIEALAMGVPVIASSIAGIPDLIKDKQTGLIVPPEDEKSLANAIKDLLFDKQLYDHLAFQGKNEVLKNFNISETIKQLNDAMIPSLANHNQ